MWKCIWCTTFVFTNDQVLHSSVSSKLHFYIQNYIDSNSIIFFKKMHIKIKFLQKSPKELLIIVLLVITEPFLLMDKLDLVKHSQLQEKFNTIVFKVRWRCTVVMYVGTILKNSTGLVPVQKMLYWTEKSGGPEKYADRGLIPRTLNYLFQQYMKQNEFVYKTHVSYLEVRFLVSDWLTNKEVF